MSRAFGGPTWSAPPACATCVLPESRAGFARALAGREAPHLIVFPGAAGWDDSIAQRVRSGQLVIFESAAGFAGAGALQEQQAGLGAFGLDIERPVALWTEGRPSYLDLAWPVRARVRDFSHAVAVRGGETAGALGGRPVAALQRAGAGALLFLGSPIGSALWSGDPQAHAWLSAVLAVAHPTRSGRRR